MRLSIPAACSISSNVLNLPNVNLTVDKASPSGNPIAFNTCDGSYKPDVQAEPELIINPGALEMITSEPIPGNVMLVVPGSLHFLSPFIFTPSIDEDIFSSNASRSFSNLQI